MLNQRKNSYTAISNLLATMSDLQISSLISTKEGFKTSIGGQSGAISLSGNSIFVKKLPLTDIERRPENIQSTANLFQLPPSCHYGIGSPGFGAWREIFVHRMTTNWVLMDQCHSFPMMYHWRVLETDKINKNHQELLEKEIIHWKDSLLVRHKVEAVQKATAEIVIFLEYIPQTLNQWLKSQLMKQEKVSDRAVSFVDQGINNIIAFIRSQGFIHFDAHVDNILTDGDCIYLTDFGLSLSKNFDLSDAEKDLFNTHQDYDQYWMITGLVYCIIVSKYGKEGWEFRLKEYLDNSQKNFSPFIHSILVQYGRVVLKMFDFYKKLKRSPHLKQYPTKDLYVLLREQ